MSTNNVSEDLLRSLSGKLDLIIEQNSVIVEQNNSLAEQNNALAEQNSVLVEQNNILSNRLEKVEKAQEQIQSTVSIIAEDTANLLGVLENERRILLS